MRRSGKKLGKLFRTDLARSAQIRKADKSEADFKVLLELGGNNAVVVEKDADLQMALQAVIFAAIGTA